MRDELLCLTCENGRAARVAETDGSGSGCVKIPGLVEGLPSSDVVAKGAGGVRMNPRSERYDGLALKSLAGRAQRETMVWKVRSAGFCLISSTEEDLASPRVLVESFVTCVLGVSVVYVDCGGDVG